MTYQKNTVTDGSMTYQKSTVTDGSMTYQKNTVTVVLSWLHTAFLFAPLYLLVGSAAKLKGRELLLFAAMGAGVLFPVILSYYMLRKMKHLWGYAAFALILTGIGFAVGFWYGSYFHYSDYFYYGNVIAGVMNCGIFLTIFGVRAYSKIVHSGIKEEFYAVHDEKEPFLLEPWEIKNFLTTPSVNHWVWFTILYLIGLLFKYHYVLYEIFFLLAADVFICFVCRYSDSFLNYLRENYRVAGMPVSSMRKVHGWTLLAGMLLIMLFLLPAVIYHREPLENVSFPNRQAVKMDMAQQQETYEALHMEPDTELQLLLAEYSEHHAPRWIRYLMNTVFVLAGIAAGVTFVYSVIQGIRAFMHAYQIEEEDEVINLNESGEMGKKMGRNRKIMDYLSKEAGIRRRFKRAIRKGTKGTPKSYATPEELEKDACFADHPEYQGLHEQYENVRYGEGR